MKNTSRILLCLMALAPLSVHAQKIYMCKDASGRTLTSDRPIPECADRAVRELDSSGITRRDIAAPLTAAQKRQKQAEEEKRKAGEAAAAEQKQTDHAIMARYRNDADVGTARKRTLDIVQEQMKRELASLAVAEKAYKGSQAEIGLIKNKKDVPAGLQRKLEEFEQAVRNGKKKIQEQEIEIAQINAKYDAELARFRELSGTAAAK